MTISNSRIFHFLNTFIPEPYRKRELSLELFREESNPIVRFRILSYINRPVDIYMHYYYY